MSKDKRFDRFHHPLRVSQAVDDTYDYVAEFAVADGSTNYDVNAQQADAFKNVTKAWLAVIWTDQDITVRFNSTSNPAIDIKVGDVPWELRNILEITNIFITNASGSIANVRLMLV